MSEYQVIARKWRPQCFSDVVGQEHVVRTLRNAIRQQRTAHAYLFVGPRGVGKTTLARIFAKAMNCLDPQDGEPCCKCVSCRAVMEESSLDVIEIDAASRNSAADMRELAEDVMHQPVAGRYKIYIIDEVHMLTAQAWNALLKTVEEPPAHVKFIFATTEVHKVLKTIISRCQRFDLLPRYELLLAAASGGMDSMCLLDFLYENGYRVCAAHYNHQLRGQEADMDEDLVRAWCAARRIPLCVGTGDVAAYAGENGLTIEEAARKLRYDFLNSVAGQTGAARIVTAHHANDNAETVLFHLARGTGMAGLAGIAPKNGRLVRPFLCLTREELAAYAKEHHVPYRTDATNADTALTRNFIRAEVVPKLCRVNAQAVEHIGETALRLRQEDEYLDSLAAAYLTELKTEAGAVTLPCAAVAQAHAVLRPRVLRLALDALGAGKKDFTAAHYDALAALCAGSGTAQLDLPGGVTARRADGVLALCAHRRETPERVLLCVGETVRWGGFAITCRKCEKTVENSENTVILRGAALDAPLSVGAWDARESMTLPVSRGSRSLKRLFAERGFSPDEREQTPVIRSGGAVAAVYGIGTDALFLPGDGESVCVLTFEKTAE